MDRDEIIRRLEKIAGHAVHTAGEPPLVLSLDDGIALYDAAALLKEQEIKSMTLEELDEIYEKQDTHIWPFDTPPYLWMTVNPDVRLTDGFWASWSDIKYSIENDAPFYVRENYGKAWLIWKGKPTQEQVQAVKWE